MHVSQSVRGMASLHVSASKGEGMASVHVNASKGGVASVHVSPNQGEVNSLYDSSGKEGMAYTNQSH